MKGRSHHHHRLQSSDPPDDWVNGSWTVDCVCGVTFDDGEEMVDCDECGVWVHTRCSRYKGNGIFVCEKCKINNNQNNSEETEVAKLLVELPTKTVRLENSCTQPKGPPRQPFRLWTEIPLEERVHVQGIPGGDPALFGGVKSIFTPELWKCTGYVPKKFNFQYREFPCWDEKGEDGKVDEENENPVDKGAGVLFSLSKESAFASPVANLARSRGGGEEDTGHDQRKFCLKERKKREVEGVDVRRLENGARKESSVVRPLVAHSGKRKKDDSGMSKDRSGKKKARPSEKEVDAKKRVIHSSKTVLTPTSDAKHLAFYEDRASKFPKGEAQITKNRNLREAVVKEPTSDRLVAAPSNVKHHSKETLSSDISVEDCAAGVGPREDKIGPLLPALPESSPKVDDCVGSVGAQIDVIKTSIKEEVENNSNHELQDDSLQCSEKNFGNPFAKDVPEIASEKENRVQNSNGDLSLKSEKPSFEVKKEDHDNSSGSLLKVQSSPAGPAKDPSISHPSDHMSESPKPSGATAVSHSSDHEVQDGQGLEAVSDSLVNKADQISGAPCQLQSELEDSESLIATLKSPSEKKRSSDIPEDHSRSGGTILHSQRKMAVCTGKSSTSTTLLIPQSSTSDDVKSADDQKPNLIAKLQIMPDSNAILRKDRASHDIRDEDRDDISRRTVKERPKPIANSIPKPSSSSRILHDSLPKKTTPESKDNDFPTSSRTSSAANTAAATSGSSEPAVSLHHQKFTNTHNRSSTSGMSHKGEKSTQQNFQPSCKMNQHHVPSVCPPVSSSSPATLSDEELALLLHQELNSSPRVPRVPRVRNAGSLPQLASPSATSMLIKRTSSSGVKDQSTVSRRKHRDSPREVFRSSRETADEAKRMDKVSSSHDPKRRDTDYTADTCTKREDNGSSAMESKKNVSSTSAATNSGPSSSNDANDRNLSSIRSSPRNTSDDDAGTVGGPVQRTLPGLINEIMSKGKRMTYEELCGAVLPHWNSLRKHNGERYAYSSPSQAVLDCLRNRHEWARLVDRSPKTNSSRKRRKPDADDSEDEYGKGKTKNEVESKSLESQKEDFPKGKRKARKRRRLALQGRGIKDIRKSRKRDMLTDEDFGTSRSSSEESLSSDDEIQGGGSRPDASEASGSSDEAGPM